MRRTLVKGFSLSQAHEASGECVHPHGLSSVHVPSQEVYRDYGPNYGPFEHDNSDFIGFNLAVNAQTEGIASGSSVKRCREQLDTGPIPSRPQIESVASARSESLDAQADMGTARARWKLAVSFPGT